MPPERRTTLPALTDPEGTGPRIFFQKVPEGKTAKNRVHLDVRAAPGIEDAEERMAALEAECERLVALAPPGPALEPAPPASEGSSSCRTLGQRVLPGLTDLPAELSARNHAERPLVAPASAA